jgi:putative flippase GtrA
MNARLGALVRFGLGGVFSFGVAVGTTAIAHELAALTEAVAAALGLGSALVMNFLMLRYFVFRSTHLPVVRQLLMFLVSSGVFRGLEYVAFLVVNAISAMHYAIVLVLVLAGSFSLKFVVYEGWVFVRRARSVASEETSRRSGLPSRIDKSIP